MSTTEHQHPPKLPDDLSIRAVLAPPDSAADALEARVLAVLLDESDAAEQAAVACLLAENPALRTWHDEMKATLPLLREALHNGTAAPGLRMDETRRAALLEKLMATPDAVTQSGEKMPPANVIPWKNFLRKNFAALAACAALVLSIAAAAGLRLALDDSEAVGVASAQEVYTPSADANSMVITSNMAMPLSPPPAFGAPLASIPVSGGGLTVPAAAPAPVVDSEFKKRGFAVLDSGQANSETPAP
ncbi:MAG: hypothetical protein LBV54_02670, partial [Puniceicoccales bacterium]|nr:hypothetical protein [Puniceicoccales bacterium]